MHLFIVDIIFRLTLMICLYQYHKYFIKLYLFPFTNNLYFQRKISSQIVSHQRHLHIKKINLYKNINFYIPTYFEFQYLKNEKNIYTKHLKNNNASKPAATTTITRPETRHIFFYDPPRDRGRSTQSPRPYRQRRPVKGPKREGKGTFMRPR